MAIRTAAIVCTSPRASSMLLKYIHRLYSGHLLSPLNHSTSNSTITFLLHWSYGLPLRQALTVYTSSNKTITSLLPNPYLLFLIIILIIIPILLITIIKIIILLLIIINLWFKIANQHSVSLLKKTQTTF